MEELEKLRHTIPMVDETLIAKGMKKVTEMKFFVKPENLKRLLEDRWQDRV